MATHKGSKNTSEDELREGDPQIQGKDVRMLANAKFGHQMINTINTILI